MLQKLSEKEKKAFNLIRNRLVHSGDKPTLREINEVTGGRSPRSAVLVIDRLIEAGLLKKHGKQLQLSNNPLLNPSNINTVDIPLVGTVTCGVPILAEENIEAIIPVSTNIAKPESKYFLLRASGDSMNKDGIDDGDILIIQQQSTAENGQRVVALIDDEATVKKLELYEDKAILRPNSTNPIHKPIIVSDDFSIQGVVIGTLPRNLI